MRALIEQNAAPFARPRRAPTARGIVGGGAEPIGDGPIDAAYRPERAVTHQIADRDVEWIGALVEHHGENCFGIGVRGDEFFRVGLMHRNRLFDQADVAGLQRGDANGRVGIMRRHDEDRVDTGRSTARPSVGKKGISGKRLAGSGWSRTPRPVAARELCCREYCGRGRAPCCPSR